TPGSRYVASSPSAHMCPPLMQGYPPLQGFPQQQPYPQQGYPQQQPYPQQGYQQPSQQPMQQPYVGPTASSGAPVFGAQGELILSADRLFGLSFWSSKLDLQNNNADS